MNADRLLAHYERIADAPDAIQRLRRFVLDLAIRGKLVPQHANDEPASELLKRIAREKARLVEAGQIRTPKAASPLADLPFAIPSNWRWSQLAEIGLLSPRNDAPDACEASFVPMPLISAEYGVANQHEVRNWGTIKKGYTHFAEGDVGLAKITPCFENGKSTVFRNLAGGIGAGTTELHVVRPLFVDQSYILIFLKCPHFIETGIPRMTGTAGQKRVPTEYFAYSPFPLPPVAEQHRIVAKVDELMGLCDRLDVALAAANSARARLLDVLLAKALVPADDSSRTTTVEPSAPAASPGAAITTERSAFVLSLAYERHRSARRDRTFGHVKAEKILHLVEAEAGLDLGRAPIRDAAGPNDFSHLLGVERWAKQHRRFAFNDNGKGYTFERLAEFQTSLDIMNAIDATMRARIERIIDLFVPMDMQAAELFATVYAAWNNLLIEGKSPEDSDIVRAAREDWHPKKLQIPREKFVAALRQVKASEFVPSGRGKFVASAQQQDLFLG